MKCSHISYVQSYRYLFQNPKPKIVKNHNYQQLSYITTCIPKQVYIFIYAQPNKIRINNNIYNYVAQETTLLVIIHFDTRFYKMSSCPYHRCSVSKSDKKRVKSRGRREDGRLLIPNMIYRSAVIGNALSIRQDVSPLRRCRGRKILSVGRPPFLFSQNTR